MESRTTCPSKAWDDYCEQYTEDPRCELIAEWIEKDIEVYHRTLKTQTGESGIRIRSAFKGEDGFPDDPHDVATGVSEWLAKHPALFEVAYVLANRGDK